MAVYTKWAKKLDHAALSQISRKLSRPVYINMSVNTRFNNLILHSGAIW